MTLNNHFKSYAEHKGFIKTDTFYNTKAKTKITAGARLYDGNAWIVEIPGLGKKPEAQEIGSMSFSEAIQALSDFEKACLEAKYEVKEKATSTHYKRVATGENYHLSFQGTLHKTNNDGLIIEKGDFQLSQFNKSAEKQKQVSGVQAKGSVFDQIIDSLVEQYCTPQSISAADFETPEAFKARQYENIVRELIEQSFADDELTVQDYCNLSNHAITALNKTTGSPLLSHKVIVGLNTVEVGIDVGRKIYQKILTGEDPKAIDELDTLIDNLEYLTQQIGCNQFMYELKSAIMSDDKLPNIDYIFDQTAEKFTAVHAKATKPVAPTPPGTRPRP